MANSNIKLFIALGVVFFFYFLLPATLLLMAKIIILWVIFATTMLILNWTLIINAHPRDIHSISKKQNSNKIISFVFVILGAFFSLIGVILLLGSVKKLQQQELGSHAILAIVSVVTSWFLVHTTFLLRYAHIYYEVNLESGFNSLTFPTGDNEEPDYLDFAYFSFIIGMTFQVSDVSINGRILRRVCLVHAILSFGFNTVIIALTINTLSGII